MSKMTNLKKGVVGVCAATMLAGMCALQTSEAGVDAADKLYLAIGGKHLTASGNGDAIASLAQTTAGTADIGIAMTGKMYNPTYSAATTGLKLATLTWTLAAV